MQLIHNAHPTLTRAGLFTAPLARLNADHIERRTRRPELTSSALGAPPTNQQILDAAKAAYSAHQVAVDASTTGGVAYAQTDRGKSQIHVLNSYSWQRKVADASIATPVYTDSAMASAVQAAQADSALLTLVYGISADAQCFLGAEGGIGIAFGLTGGGDVAGLAYVAGKFGLDIDAAVNLQIGLWTGSPQMLSGNFYGLEVNVDLEVSVSLGIFLDIATLQPSGFSLGVGCGLGGGATLVDGNTWIF
jgi:hypothetical protein